MRILYYDCYVGISGDMHLGALVDIGVDPQYLTGEIAKLHLESEYRIEIRKTQKMGISGTKVDVILLRDDPRHEPHGDGHAHGNDNGHGDDHIHGDDHHSNSFEVCPNQDASHDEHRDSVRNHGQTHDAHRNIHDIEAILYASTLPEKIINESLGMFMRLAQAEAAIHGKTVEEVHFHEVGAIDSIIDIVGAAIAIDYLKVDKILCSPVQVGGGFVKCAHGLLPVPAPATAELLRGIPIVSGLVPFEATTPTGAVILAENVDEFTEKIEFAIDKIGYGFGSKDFEVPNALRVYLGTADDAPADVPAKSTVELHGQNKDTQDNDGQNKDTQDNDVQNNNVHENAGLEKEEQFVIETNIDDMNPEFFSFVEEKLFEAGALDVYTASITMKKGRPATKLIVLVSRQSEEGVLRVLFMETTSIGVRKIAVEKIMLKREFMKIGTKWGAVAVKISYFQGKRIKYKAEYEDCRKIAGEKNLPIDQVYKEIDRIMDRNIWRNHTNDDT